MLRGIRYSIYPILAFKSLEAQFPFGSGERITMLNQLKAF